METKVTPDVNRSVLQSEPSLEKSIQSTMLHTVNEFIKQMEITQKYMEILLCNSNHSTTSLKQHSKGNIASQYLTKQSLAHTVSPQ